jgi:hypothetical protein
MYGSHPVRKELPTGGGKDSWGLVPQESKSLDFGAEKRIQRLFSKKRFAAVRLHLRVDGHGFSRGTVARYAESVSFEKWGLEH